MADDMGLGKTLQSLAAAAKLIVNNEIKRIISYYNPVEILLHTKNFDMDKENFVNQFKRQINRKYHKNIPPRANTNIFAKQIA